LGSYTGFIETSCILSLETPRDAFLTSLCNTTLPLWFTIDNSSDPNKPTSAQQQQQQQQLSQQQQQQQLLTDKNVLAVQSLLSVGRSFGPVLEDGWYLVLECCEKLDHLMRIRGGQTSNTASQSVVGGVSSVTSEQIAMLCSGLDAIFNESTNLSDQALFHLVLALTRLSANNLQSPQSLAAQAPTRKSFALTRLIEVVSNNIARLEVVWDTLLDHLRIVCTGICRHAPR
jgi:hypothetical protein